MKKQDNDIEGKMNFLTVKEISKEINVAEGTIYYWVNQETIPFWRFNGNVRFLKDEVLEHFREKNKKPKKDYSFKAIMRNAGSLNGNN